MARCSSCNKFVSYDEPQVEEDNIEVNDNEVSGGVLITLACADCGDAIAECNIDFSETFDHECDLKTYQEYTEGLGEEAIDWIDSPEYEVTGSDWSPTDRFENKDSKGKLIKNSRYMKHYYGAECTATVTCLKCGEEIEVPISVEEQASCFESLN